ncbi:MULTISPECIES: Flp family type IVb pilin [Marinobacter]|jgi:Flp pilus assembly pilin Flp|uniref:Flp family type IVb pilin n=1 Tax=Marinobacter adhaerens (strain DSM 23420 / HP15) TaxID=225937 RepID=E4PRW6_MARAH|nr:MULTISPECIES: hypothetical protein [Marinobacter]ADQ00001.1 hypothetical protein HP15_p187g4 [Marinobacter adhaerens HP15]MBW4980201.1 hypothetical protein [Marinobacter adhaerens]|tara:strand:+ start:13815 stop:14018 length:204 start_codon:yes stop_codon:yes gene_type:complete
MKQMIFKRSVQPRLGREQKGASSLEYIALAGILVLILVAVGSNETISTQIQTTLSSLFTDASGTGPE